MDKSKVYFVNTKQMVSWFGFTPDSLIARLERLWSHKEVNLNEWIKPGDKVIIKTHFASINQTRHLRPMYIRKIVEIQLSAAEALGIGSRSCELLDVTEESKDTASI